MKRIRAQVTYNVPHWAFCNCDDDELTKIPKRVCRFCVKSKGARMCMLYGEQLVDNDGLVYKTQRCKAATAGYEATIIADHVEPPVPTVNPKDLIKQTIDLYAKTVNSLLNQGYPRAIAEQAAKQHILDN